MLCVADSTVAETARDVALMILSRSYHQTHPNTSTFTAQHGPAHIDGTDGGGSGSSTSGSAGKAQHGQFGAAVRDSSDATLETLSQLLGRLRRSDYLYSESPAMRGYGARILLQYVQRTPTTPSQVRIECNSSSHLLCERMLRKLLVVCRLYVLLSCDLFTTTARFAVRLFKAVFRDLLSLFR
jgi:hypothetical protein